MPFCLYLLTGFVLLAFQANAQLLVDAETGVVFNTKYNNIRIPGAGGTKFNAADYSSNPTWFYRLRVGYTFNDRHTVSALYAPLQVKYTGESPAAIYLQGETFRANVPITVDYTFNSYRLTYRYDFIRNPKFRLGAGLTAKVRDAAVELQNEQAEARKTNVGFVPLINFRMSWNFTDRFQLLVEGDALAAPQGRAEDVFAGLGVGLPGNKVTLKAGYRLLEGGADNDEVYNFTWFDYASAGVILRL